MKFKLYRKIVITIAFFCGNLLVAQELPPIQNFSPKDYSAQNQNWSISQAVDKTIYIANNKGLLAYNGAGWKLYPTPNETIMRSVKVVGDKIFTGCFMDFGYWEKDQFNQLKYVSIVKTLNIKVVEDEQFWDIINIDNWVVFRSLNRIYFYNINDENLKTISSKSTISAIYKVKNQIYFQRLNEGVFKIENGKDVLVSDKSLVKNNDVINIFEHKSSLLFQTKNKGIYIFRGNAFQVWDTKLNTELSQFSVYKSIELKDGSFILGTISNGIKQINSNGEITLEIYKKNGLNNNTVLSLFEDIDENIWLGLDIGISNINLKSPFKIYNDVNGKLGSTYTSIVYENKLYLGTNHGLFSKTLNSKEEFNIVPGTEGQVWCLEDFDETLFCGHDSGTFIIKKDKAAKISNIQGAWNFKQIDEKNKFLLQGSYDGFYILEKKDNTWSVRNKIKGFNISSKNFEFNTENEIFINHEYKGIYKIKVDSSFSKVISTKIDSTIKGANSGIVKHDDQIFYSYKNGVFKFKKSEDKFIKDSLYSSVYDENDYSSGILIENSDNKILWNFSNSSINYIKKDNLSGEARLNKITLNQGIRESIVGYENILQLDPNNYLIGNASGYIIIDLSKIETTNFNINIDQIHKSKNNTFESRNLLNLVSLGSFNSNEKNVKISYNVPKFSKYLDIQYQYQLKGIYNEWSNWSASSNKVFENLPFGDYTFNVKAKIGNKTSENIATYSFNIEKPWYISNLMLIAYSLFLILFYLLIHNLYKSYYKKQKIALLKRKEREHTLSQAEKEKEIIAIKNEQLRQENLNKNKELATSTMNIIKKNELLKNIKYELTQVKNEKLIKPVINIIDKNLNHEDDWNLFYEAFNSVDKNFLNKIKEYHPNLSPNDLRLCAYLRLNLSSKEIAPLLNISYKSVEIKRYRLRKKLKLQSKVNLTKYILDI